MKIDTKTSMDTESLIPFLLSSIILLVVMMIFFIIFSGVIPPDGIHNILEGYIVINTGFLAIIFAVNALKPSNEVIKAIKKSQLFTAYLIIAAISISLCSYIMSYIQSYSVKAMTYNFSSSNLFYASAWNENSTIQAQGYAEILSPFINHINIISNTFFVFSTLLTLLVIFSMILLIRSNSS